MLLSIREDQKQNLWMSTENGISKFIPGEERFENYDDRSITFRVRFSEAASAVTSKGKMLFGASNGIFMFDPDSINKSRFVPPIVLSKLVIANQDIVPGEGSVLKVGLDDTKELVLSHKENILPFSMQHSIIRIRRIFSMLIFLKVLNISGRMPTGCVMPLILTCRRDTIHLKYVLPIVTVCGWTIPGFSTS